MIPFTFYHYYGDADDRKRREIFKSFADNGVKNLVLADELVGQIAGQMPLLKKLQQELDEFGLTFVDSHAPFDLYCDLATPGEAGAMTVARHILVLETAHQFGVKSCCMHLAAPRDYPQHTLAELYDAIRKNLEQLLPEAEKRGIVICIENIFKPLNTVSTIEALLKEFNTPALGVCYDAGHANIMEKGMDVPDSYPWNQWKPYGEVEWEENVLQKLLPHIVTCHLHDNFVQRDDHAMPGKGTVDWATVLPLLKTAPRLQCMQSEVIACRHNISISELVSGWNSLLKQYGMV